MKPETRAELLVLLSEAVEELLEKARGLSFKQLDRLVVAVVNLVDED